MKFNYLKLASIPKRVGVAGRVPLPGSALANHTFDGFGSKAFVPVPEDSEEDEDVAQFFIDEEPKE